MTTAFDRLFANYPATHRSTQVEAVPQAGFSGAGIWRVKSPSGPFCLRRWPDDAPPAARLAGLHRLLEWTHARGVPLAVPVRTLAGKTLCEQDGGLWQLEPWLPGTADFHADPSDARLSAVMRTLAELHRTTAAYHAPAEDAEWFAVAPRAVSPAVQGRLRILASWQQNVSRLRPVLTDAAESEFRELGRELLDHFGRLSAEVADQLRCALRVPVPLVPCLRDVWHDHVLWTGDAVTGLVDPSACRSDSVATDLSRLLGSLLGGDRDRWDFALAEYARHRPLSLDEFGLVPVLDRSGVLLSGMTWLERRFLKDQPLPDESRVLARLRTICERLRCF
jgi:Ser/Thr protein kinase RdoA (MazF antagonist)